MKKNIKKAQMGGLYAQRRAYKSAGASKPSPSSSSSKKDSKSSIQDVPEGIKKLVDNKDYINRIKVRKNDSTPLGKTQYNPKYLGPSGKDYVKDALEEKGSAPRQGPIKRAGSSSSAPKSTGSGGTKTSGSKGGGAKRKPVRTASVAVPSAKRDITKQGAPSKPSVPGIQSRPERTEFSKRESKIAAQVQKMKSGKTSTEAGQARIASLQAREKMAKQKAMRKEKRAAVKAVKQSYK